MFCLTENFSGVDYPADKFRKLMAVNVDGTFFCAREAAKDMMKRGAPGSIIMLVSLLPIDNSTATNFS